MKYNKFLKTTILSLATVALPVTVTSCSFLESLFSSSSPDNSNKTQNDNFKYISERSFSLKFWDPSINSEVYGTGWLFAKSSINDGNYYDDDYYIATNLHVASAIQNRGKTSWEFNANTKTYEQQYYPNYKNLDLGYVISKKANGQYEFGTNYSSESISSTHYLTTLDIDTSVSIAYTTFNLFKNMKLEDSNRVYNSSIFENPTSDIAIIKINFSNAYTKDFHGINPLKSALDIYNKNPTKFGNYNQTKNITIAGFPFKEDTLERGGKWTASYHPSPFKISNQSDLYNVSTGIIFGNNKLWQQGIQSSNIDEIKKDYVINGFIPYKTDEFACYYNVALQGVFKNVELSGGSSGSLVLDDNQNVVGIYWGGYSLTSGEEIGAMDIFVNEKTFFTERSSTSPVIKPYSILEDFKTYVKNVNI
ncbi:DUF31 family putative serine protease [Malacoplasma muris]|uniref:DUF31 family putative serine protease n=1 Tax=Malacoplasma muris TaxID=2119 RepID=UPI00398ED96F